jgi:hypothetical protein
MGRTLRCAFLVELGVLSFREWVDFIFVCGIEFLDDYLRIVFGITLERVF